MYTLREICKAEPFERPLHRSFFFSAHFLFNFYDYDSLWVFMSESGVTSNVVDKFAWNGFCIVKIATCKTCAIILVVAKKQKPQNTELEFIFNWHENRILANNSCAVIMCVFLLFMSRNVSLFDDEYQSINAFTWLCLRMKHFHFISWTGNENEASFDSLTMFVRFSFLNLLHFTFYFVQCFFSSPANAKIGIQKTQN